jgi:ATP-dependent Lhr-like helicase
MSLNSKDNLAWAHPLVRDWFLSQFGSATEPQAQGWPSISAGRSTLISAPTGSGKTLAAFLVCIDRLVRRSLAGELQNQTEVLYISPLKALGHDIHHNLTQPLSEIRQLANQRGLIMSDISVAVRTGDTLNRERQAMLKKPPHILVTTPESLYILLTAEKSRIMLKTVKTIIVDEIHAVVNDKRGAHLALSLERLDALTEQPSIRIGLSATQKPMELVARFLAGKKHPLPMIVDIGHRKQMALKIDTPIQELSAIASNDMWDEIYDKVATLTQENKSTLIFVNTRRVAERVAHHLAERIGKDNVAVHHGSLSRKLRHLAEKKLKNGELKALVATASLELGIDIGSVDLVCQLGSPRAIAVTLQRIGRAGHWRGAISKGHLFATTRDELLECAALIYAIHAGDIEALCIPSQPLDILMQQIIATCATGDWRIDDLFQLMRNAFPYQELTRESFDLLIKILTEGIAGSRGRYGSYLFHDQVNGIVKARRGSRLTAITCGGAIPVNSLFTVIAEPSGMVVGTLDEDFAIESNRNDIILLGTTSWQIKRIESATARVIVENAHGAPPSVPFWLGEAPGRTAALSLHVSALRKKISDMIPADCPNIHEISSNAAIIEAINWLMAHCDMNENSAKQLLEYVRQGRAILGEVPTHNTIIAERFFDESGGMQLIIHAPLGARINKAWGLALRKRFCKSFNFELQAAATDNGINISLTEQHSFPLEDVFHFLHPNTVKEVLTQAVVQSPLFTTRWRWTATRSLALARFRYGRKVPPHILRMLSEDLLAAVFPDAAACQDNMQGRDIQLPDHPLTNETMKDALTEALDLGGLLSLLNKIITKEIKCVAVDTPLPSVFSHEILNANPYAFLDDAPLEERRARAVEMRRILPQTLLKEIGKLDPEMIREVQAQAWPDIRNIDELHDFLQTVVAFPINFTHLHNENLRVSWEIFFPELLATRRVLIATYQETNFYVAAEKSHLFSSIYPESTFKKTPIVALELLSKEESIVTMLRGWLSHLGPTTAQELSTLLNLSVSMVGQALLHLESTGFVLRGQFRILDQVEWCERRLLARIHRLTLSNLRKEIEPITPNQFFQWLLKWQHLVPGTQLKGQNGVLEIIRQLQGFEIPAYAWEKQILAKRVSDYNRDMLDHLCLTGVIGWGRFSRHPLQANSNAESSKQVINPTSVAPITFFIREESDWIPKNELVIENLSGLNALAKEIYVYLQKSGASFFADIARHIDNLKSEIEMGLWQLVSAGKITADSFDNLRSLIDQRRRVKKRGARYSTGRWSLLHTNATTDHEKQMEAVCWTLLKRYGVVFRDLLAREKNIPRWRDLLTTYRRLEDRGDIRGGRFISGFLGEQFALPYAVDSLRAMRKEEKIEDTTFISTMDPLNLIGIILPGPRASAASRKEIHFPNKIHNSTK